MENDLRHAKSELVLNSERIQKFMEDGSKTIEEYRTRYDQANEEILILKHEILAKESLLKTRDDVYKRALDDLQDARKSIGALQLEKLQVDTKNSQLEADLDRCKEEKAELEDRVIELESIQNKIKKQNELFDELKSEFYGLSLEELSQQINKSMYSLVLKLRKDHLKQIINGTLDLKHALEEDKKFDLVAQLKELENLKVDSDEEFDNDASDSEPDDSKPKSSKPKNKRKTDETDDKKVKRTGGGFKIQSDSDLEKDDKKDTANKEKSKVDPSKSDPAKPAKDEDKKDTKDATPKSDKKDSKTDKNKESKDEEVKHKPDSKNVDKKEPTWKEKVDNAKQSNEKLKLMMNVSQVKEKDKDGKWKTKEGSEAIYKNAKNPPKVVDEKLVKENEKLSKNNEKLSKDNEDLKSKLEAYTDKLDTYANMLTFTTKNIVKYVLEAKLGIDKIEKDYKGFYSTRDEKLIKMVTNAKNEEGDRSSKDKISELKRNVSDLKSELKLMKTKNSDLDTDIETYKKKDQVLRSKLTRLDLEADEIKHEYEMRIHEYKSVLRAKDEEITNLKEHNRSQEKLTHEYGQKTSANTYELELTKKKLGESKHHQDLLNRRLHEYEDIVRVINKNLKQNTSESSEAGKSLKVKDRELETTKSRCKILEEEIHKREETILKLKNKLKKMESISLKDTSVDNSRSSKNYSFDLDMDKKTRDYTSQIEVLKEMITGLKAQLKAKEMDGYRQDTKILSLQSQIDILKAREKQLESQMNTDYNSIKYSPANVHKQLGIKSSKEQDSVYETSRRGESRESAQNSKPLIKSGIKVQNKKNADNSSILDKIKASKNSKKDVSPLASKPKFDIKKKDSVTNSKVDANKSMFANDSDISSNKAGMKLNYQIGSDDDE